MSVHSEGMFTDREQQASVNKELTRLRHALRSAEFERDQLKELHAREMVARATDIKRAEAVRDALKALVKHVLPPHVTPSQLARYDEPWPTVARVLYGEGR